MASLVDTNVMVYCYDPADSRKRSLARELLRREAAAGGVLIPHQAMVEFVKAVTKHRPAGPFLSREEAFRQAEDFLTEFQILYPNEKVFRVAMMGMATYNLAWYDAHLWAYAEHYGLPELLSEDFEHGRKYGTVRVRNPFIDI